MTGKSLREHISDSIKDAMRSKDKLRLGTLRMAQSAFRQIEIDERRDLSDNEVLAVLDKMLKQRRDAAAQYEEGGRDDLADQEKAEMVVIQEFMPAALTEDELDGMIRQAIDDADATDMQDMGSVMGKLKPQVQGRVDRGHLSQKVRIALMRRDEEID